MSERTWDTAYYLGYGASPGTLCLAWDTASRLGHGALSGTRLFSLDMAPGNIYLQTEVPALRRVRWNV